MLDSFYQSSQIHLSNSTHLPCSQGHMYIYGLPPRLLCLLSSDWPSIFEHWWHCVSSSYPATWPNSTHITSPETQIRPWLTLRTLQYLPRTLRRKSKLVPDITESFITWPLIFAQPHFKQLSLLLSLTTSLSCHTLSWQKVFACCVGTLFKCTHTFTVHMAGSCSSSTPQP